MTALSQVLLILKEVMIEVENAVKTAQHEQSDEVKRNHQHNIALAKVLTARKYIEDAENLDISETKRLEKDLVELEVLRKIQYGEKK